MNSKNIHFVNGPLDGTIQTVFSESEFKVNKILAPYAPPLTKDTEEDSFFSFWPKFEFWEYTPDSEDSNIWIGKKQ